MNILKQHPRRSIIRKVYLEYLDQRIVPSTAQAGLVAAAEVATAHATANPGMANEGTATAESRVQIRETKLDIRRENRAIKLEEQREAAKERREARLEKLAARRAAAHQFSPAIMVRPPAALAAAASNTQHGASAASASSGGSAVSGSSTGFTPTVMPITMPPVTTTTGTTTTGTTSSVPGTTPPTTTNPLPDNVSVLLNTVYQEFENGDLSSTTQPGQVEIQGSSVGIEMRTSDPGSFAAMVAGAESLGMQISTSSATYDMVVGFLPIANLPAAAQLPGTPAIAPLLYPTGNGGGSPLLN